MVFCGGELTRVKTRCYIGDVSTVLASLTNLFFYCRFTWVWAGIKFDHAISCLKN